MELSDIEDLVRSHLIEGETLTEQPSNYFDDHMYSIITAGAPAYAYTITAENLYGIAALDALKVWAPGEDIADQTIGAVLDYARRNGQPLPPPDPEEVFADAIAYLRPLLREGETLSTSTGRNGEPFLHVSGPAGGSNIWDDGGRFWRADPLERGHILDAVGKDDKEAMLSAVLGEARNPTDVGAYHLGNR